MDCAIFIGEQQMIAVEGRLNGHNIEIKNQMNMPMPAGLMHNGQIVDQDGLAQYLSQQFKENQFKSKKIHMVLNGVNSAFKEMVLPVGSPKQLDQMVVNEMQLVLNMQHEYWVDYMIVKEVVENDQAMFRIAATALLKDEVEQYRQILKKIGLKPVSLDLGQNSLKKLMEWYVAHEHPYIVMDLRENNMMNSLIDGNEMILTRHTKVAAVSEEDTSGQQLAMLTQQSISKTIQFYKYQNPARIIRYVYFTGDYSRYEGILDEVSLTFEVETEMLVMPKFVQCPKDLDINGFSIVIGALIRR